MSMPLVEVDRVTKDYRLWHKPADRLATMLLEQAAQLPLVPEGIGRRLRAAADRRGALFHALRETSFTLRRGESLGIIGRNGSGKSTLLQILAGTLQPSTGTLKVSGRVAALLELGSGFNPEFSGRENVLLQAALFGFTRRDVEARMPEVEEFAGIGEFIDQPVKVYSSGMLVRLAFATQTIVEPELFIVDEALAVGDVFFQAKCAKFFEDRLRSGMSLILVSHDLVAVKALCQRTIVLHQGHLSFFGPSAEAVSHYHQLHRPRIESSNATVPATAPATGASVELPPGAQERNWPASQEVGSREIEIVYCRVLDASGQERAAFDLGEEVLVEFYTRSKVALAGVVFGLELTNRHNQVVYGATTVHLGAEPPSISAGSLSRFAFRFSARLGAGDYLIDAAVGWGDRGDGAPEQLLHRVARIASLSIRHTGLRPAFFGAADLSGRLQIDAG